VPSNGRECFDFFTAYTYTASYIIIPCCTVVYGAWGSVVVKALRYGPGIDSRWCHWGFFPWLPPMEPCALGSTQPLKMSTRDFSWGKGGRCLWLTTYHLCSAERQEIRDLNLPGTPWATSACFGITFTFTFIVTVNSIQMLPVVSSDFAPPCVT